MACGRHVVQADQNTSTPERKRRFRVEILDVLNDKSLSGLELQILKLKLIVKIDI